MTAKRWSGSTWVDLTAQLKRWTGSAYVALTSGKRWNGSAWVEFWTAGGGGGLNPAILLNPTDSSLGSYYGCDKGIEGFCPVSITLSDETAYAPSGGTAPYTVTAVNFDGAPVTIEFLTSPNRIKVSSSVGKNTSKSGTIKITVTDNVSSTNEFYMGYTLEYLFIDDGGGLPP